MEQFFTIQDYLASSIEKLYLILFAIPFAVGSSNIARYLVLRRHAEVHCNILKYLITILPMVALVAGFILIFRMRQVPFFDLRDADLIRRCCSHLQSDLLFVSRASTTQFPPLFLFSF